MPPPAAVSAVAEALRAAERVVLAVSGGLDSMALLHLCAQSAAHDAVVAVATFDHGSGAAAAEAARIVSSSAAALGMPVEPGRIDGNTSNATEADWRSQRWRFLAEVAWRHNARVVTAHTLDDQIETVFMRILRGTGTRGLAGLLAEGDVIRPLIGICRAELARWVERAGILYVDDPTNLSRRHLRNRVRLDLLPAVDRVRPLFREELRAIGERAAAWRADVERQVRMMPASVRKGELTIARSALDSYSDAGLGVIWPALAARAGVILDRRGTERLVAFTAGETATGSRIQLAGGAEVIARRDSWLLRRTITTDDRTQPLIDGVGMGRWRFRQLPRKGPLDSDHSNADLPVALPLSVRAWRPGDRMVPHDGSAPRRVKRFLADARIAGPERDGWPVVLAGDMIVWIPGVCRSDAATVRSGRPAVRFVCEHNTR